ncbi:DEAD/DEAH box helicase [Kineococcus rhizosphaerae]|uniref:Helicase-like protein n=1 Tax=Kineococcus rhizosphaerae TaxID=559628 RepID=A0A2T0R4V3_9ACTN|nr:DEAD/DEAH box helicase [Kineococcus rhizosphaerae]PRY15340.1 helicase-like protein [Kineococcus rhizosphaerae]
MLVVHGLWTREHSLALWVEAPRRRPGPARAADLADLARQAPRAAALACALASPATSTVSVSLPCTPSGRPAASTGRARADLRLLPVELEVVDLRGARALEVLTEVAEQDLPVADGLRWLAHVAAGARRAVDAGHVVPDLHACDGRFRARWVPAPDRAFGRWRTVVAQACPPVLRAERSRSGPAQAPDLLDDVCAVVVDVLVADRTRDVVPHDLPANPSLRAWLLGLRSGEALADDADRHGTLPSLARRVRDWHRSGEDAGYDVLLRVVEPEPWEDVPDGLADGKLDGTGGEAPADLNWRLQTRLRPLDDPSLVLTLAEARAEGGSGRDGEDPLLVLLTGTARAGTAHPPLKRILGGRTDAAAEHGVELSIAELLDLVEVGGPKLAAAGVGLQLPRHWTKKALSFSLTASAAQPGAITAPQVRQAELLDFRWQAALGDSPITEAELLALAASKSSLVRFRGEWVQVDADTLRRSATFLRRRGTGRASIVDVLAAVGSGRDLPGPVTSVDARGVLGDVLSGQAAQRLPELPDPPGLRAELRPYQRRGLTWLATMSQLGLGAVLADDMGLGKTLQLLALLAHEAPSAPGPTLLVCPMSVVGNWAAEAARFVPGLRVHVQHGPGRPKGADLAALAAERDLVVSTYGLVVRDVTDLAAVPWHRVALDEAQHVKNANTRQARAVRAIGAAHRVALTGTPVENRLEDLRAILDTTNPGLLGSAASFRDTFAVPIEKLGQAEPAARLAVVTRPFVLRRVKTDPAVAGDLPEKIEMTVRANLTPEQAALYRRVVDDLTARLADPGADPGGVSRRGLILAALTRLKQICNHPAHYLGDSSGVLHRGRHRSGKLELLDDVVTSARAEGEKVLCFTQFAEFGHLLGPHLSDLTGEPVPFLHGGVTRRGRDAMVEEFSASDGPGVMLLSLRAGGTGLNLTAANHVVHVDRWWNPAVEDQATDRAFRIGQHRQVQVRKLVSVGTLEERVDAVITRKRGLAESVVGSGEGWITELDTDALRELIRLGDDAVGE